MPTTNQFLRAYTKIGIQKDVHFTQCCSNADECWKGLPRLGKKDNYNSIYAPYIGSEYKNTHLAVIAENMFEWGGWGSVDWLVENAKEELPFRTRVRFENEFKKYAGSFLWLWLGAYGAAFAEKVGLKSCEWKNGMPSIPDVIQGFDFLAYTNHVKCSPGGDRKDRGRPTSAMWHRCGSLILKEELRLLNPSTLLIMGKGWNQWAFQEYIFDEKAALTTNGTACYGIAKLNGKSIKVIVVPHPSWFGKARKIIMSDWRKSLAAVLPKKK